MAYSKEQEKADRKVMIEADSKHLREAQRNGQHRQAEGFAREIRENRAALKRLG